MRQSELVFPAWHNSSLAFADFVLREKAKYHNIVTDIDKTFVEMSSLSSQK
jgi:hypothetical protein